MEAQHGEQEHTIAIDGAMRARLLAIALDLLSSAFIAGAGYPPPLLEWLWLRSLAVEQIAARGVVVARFRAILVL